MADKLLVAATRRFPQPAENRVAARYAFRAGDDEANYTPESMARLCRDAWALLNTPTESLSADVIAALPASVKVLSTVSVGFEHIDLAAAKARGMRVTNTPGVLTDATADIALLLILGATRRASDGERMLREGRWTGLRPTRFLGMQVTGKTLGIVGMGRIGAAVAGRAEACGMRVIYHNRNRVDPQTEGNAVYVPQLQDLLAQSDVVSLHAPLTPETKGLMNAQRITLMKDGACLVNTARGPLVDDDAVIAALKSGKLSSIGLDVFTGEPNFDPRYKTLENAMLIPHFGSATVETRTAMAMVAVDNIDAIFEGREPPFPVV
jgi:lactate dehydrogenase-like 2-hydroxyacid dehydrogenase